MQGKHTEFSLLLIMKSVLLLCLNYYQLIINDNDTINPAAGCQSISPCLIGSLVNSGMESGYLRVGLFITQFSLKYGEF